MDAFSVFYGGESAEKTTFVDKVKGSLAGVYWATILLNITLPQLMWFRRLRLNQTLIMLVSFGVIVGMWCERYTIVVMSLRRTHLPSEWAITTPHFGTGRRFLARLACSPSESFCAFDFCQ
jgi:hypothetical protein